MIEHTYAVIMAGGGGTRLWPVSRRDRPKQMVPLIDDRTLFQTTVQRLGNLFQPEQILVVTVEEQEKMLREQAPEIPQDNFLLEPAPRGTASVIGLAAVVLKQRDPEAVMVVLPSDHFIRNQDLFQLLIRIAVDVAKMNYLVTLGITPTYPSTAYGYIQRGESLPDQFLYPVYEAVRFKEKPDQSSARIMLAKGDHSWNSGMFIWRSEVVLKEFSRQMPGLYKSLTEIGAAWGTERQNDVIRDLWPALEVKTIDYGIMENAAMVAVLPASGLGWSDVGSWDSLFDVLLSDENDNIVFGGQHISLDTRKTLVYGNDCDRLIVTIGVDNLVIVDTGDVLLICDSDRAQSVREIVATLRETGKEDYI